MSYDLVDYRWCSSNENYELDFRGRNDEVYTVSYNRHNPGPYAVNWGCTCPGFKFRKSCKHVILAEKKHCGYGAEAAMGSPEPDLQDKKTCPKCGAPTSVVRVAI